MARSRRTGARFGHLAVALVLVLGFIAGTQPAKLAQASSAARTSGPGMSSSGVVSHGTTLRTGAYRLPTSRSDPGAPRSSAWRQAHASPPLGSWKSAGSILGGSGRPRRVPYQTLTCFGLGLTSGCMQLNGNTSGLPSLTSGDLTLANRGTGGTTSSAFYIAKQDVTKPFTTNFTFNIEPQQRSGANQADPPSSGDTADGFAFVIQNSSSGATAVGGGGGGLGYNGLASSVAVEFDPFSNWQTTDPFTGNPSDTNPNDACEHVAILEGGDTSNDTTYQYRCVPVTGQAMSASIHYSASAATPTLSVSINGQQVLNYPVNLSSAVGSSGYFGFTGATGSLTDTVDITNWTFVQDLVANGSFESPVAASSGDNTLLSTIPGWTACGSATSSIEISGGQLGAAEDGNQYTELNSTAPGALCETLPTFPGQSYQLSFWFSPRANDPVASDQMDVTWGSDDLTPNRIVGNGIGQTGTSWRRFSFTVTATTAATTLKFADVGVPLNGICACGDLLDNVQVLPASSSQLNTNPPVFGAVEVLGTNSSWTVDGGTTNAVETGQCAGTWVNQASLSSAKWIWSPDACNANTPVVPNPGSSHTFAKHFSVNQQPAYATLQIAADNYASVSINNQTVFADTSSQRFDELRTFDVTGYLKSGDNLIQITAYNAPNADSSAFNPAGVLAQLTLQDGSYSTGANGGTYYTIYGTSVAPLALTGNGDPGANVAVYTGGSCAGNKVGTATVDVTGDWATSVTGLTEGSQPLSAKETLQGVDSSCSGPLNLVVDRTPPTSTISFPTAYVNAAAWTTRCASSTVDPGQSGICGTAADNGSGVALVLVVVGNPSGHFWNGTDWTSNNPVWLRADLGPSSGGVRPFKLPLAMPSPDGTYFIASGAIDNAGILETFLAQNVCDATVAAGNGCVNLDGDGISYDGGGSSLNGGGSSFNGGGSSLNGGGSSLNGGGSSFNGGGSSFNGGGSSFNGGGSSFNGGGSSFNGGGSSLNGGGSSFNGGGSSFNGGGSSFNGGGSSLNGGGSSLNGGGSSLNGGAGTNTNSEYGNVVVDNVSPWVSSFEVDSASTSGAIQVNPGATFHIHFNEGMNCNAVNGTTIQITPAPTTLPSCDTLPNSTQLDPTYLNAHFSGFAPNTTYTVTVTSAVTDLAGNALGTNNGANPNTFTFTTSPFFSVAKADADQDNIPDGWDGTTTPTFTLNGKSTNTAAWGFKANHQDLCLVENYMVGTPTTGTGAGTSGFSQAISQAANQAIVNAFANAPTTLNTDGSKGVHLVIFEGDAAHSAGLPPGYSGPYFGGPVSMVDPLGITTAGSFNWGAGGSNSFDSIRAASFQPPGLAQFCHYALIAHTLGGTTSSGASRGIGASDIVVALGGTVAGAGVGTQLEQAGTLMHELGHNLYLRHGGGPGVNPSTCSVVVIDPTQCDEDTNNKPNYMSVMNYLYQFTGIPGGFTTNGLDYSRGTASMLDENHLNDSQGLGTLTTLQALFGTRYFCTGTPTYVANATQPINWGCSGSWTSPGFSDHVADVNGDNVKQQLHDFNDWSAIRFNGGDIGMGAVSPPPSQTSVDITDAESGGTDSAPSLEGNLSLDGWIGFLSPLDPDSMGMIVNTGKAGRTYPIKFQLLNKSGAYITSLSAVASITVGKSAACTGTTSDPIDYTSTATTSGLKYDSTANQFVYNWATPTAGCYVLKVSLADGTSRLALFSLS